MEVNVEANFHPHRLERAREMASVGMGGFYRQKKRGGIAKPTLKRSSTGKSAAIALSFTDPDQSPVLGTLSSPQFLILCFTFITDLVHLQPAGRGYCGAREDSVGGGIRGGEAAAVRSGHEVWPLPGTQPDGAVGPGGRHGAEPAGWCGSHPSEVVRRRCRLPLGGTNLIINEQVKEKNPLWRREACCEVQVWYPCGDTATGCTSCSYLSNAMKTMNGSEDYVYADFFVRWM